MTLSWYWLPLAFVVGLFLQSVGARLRDHRPRSGTRESSDPLQSAPTLPLDELLRQLQEHRARLASDQKQITDFLTTTPPSETSP